MFCGEVKISISDPFGTCGLGVERTCVPAAPSTELSAIMGKGEGLRL